MLRTPLPIPHAPSARRPKSLVLACALLLAAACDRAPDPSASAAYDFHADERVVPLLGACEHSGPFTGDTVDPLPTMVAKLAVAEADVASRVRADLIALGPAATPELRRAFQRWFAEPGLAPRLLVMLDLAALARGDEARAMGLEALEHPSESVRIAAARVLAVTGTPADYDRVAIGVARGGPEYAAQSAVALLGCDPARVVREYPSWLDDARFALVVEQLAPSVAPIADAATRAKMLADPRVSRTTRTWFLASDAAAGDRDSLDALRAAIGDASSMQRQVALQAAVATGLAREIAPLATSDADTVVRTLALEAIAGLPDSPENRARIAAALSDPDEGVRRVALMILCGRGDASAIDAAIELLAGSNDDIALATAALRGPLAQDPELAQRVLARLEELLEGGTKSTGYAIERTIGQVPLARAAQILVERGRTATGTIQDLPVHRWYAVQAGNAGPEGRAWIRTQWDLEADPVRRLDLLVAGAQEQTPASLAFLERVLESPRASDVERLVAADLYARIAPIRSSSPVLKRAALAIESPELRRAIHCLQWRFHGPEGS